jgi:histidyl-tRNA synthetase
MTSKTIQAIRGMKDVLPDESPLWLLFEETVRGWLRLYGYRNIRLPMLEPTDLFKRSIGEATDIVEKEMFTFVDREKDSLTLRPEGTASCVRALIQHGVLVSGGPQRLYYEGPMFRHERPQKGRYRQFHQIGVEAFGFSGPDIDAEHIVMCSRLWRNLGLEGITLQLNTLGKPEARETYRKELVVYFQDHWNKLDSDSRRRLSHNPLRILDSKNPEMQPLIGNAPTFTEFLDSDSIIHFNKLKDYLSLNNVEFEINPRLVRGLDYYNNTVFEWVTKKLGSQGAICAGGRYDSLVSQLGGSPTAACGFAIGVERVIELLRQDEKSIKPGLDVYVVRQGEAANVFSWQVAEQLRDAGLSVLLHCGDGNMSNQMKRAFTSGARFAVVIGESEASARVLGVRQLRETTEQRSLPVAEAIALIKSEK